MKTRIATIFGALLIAAMAMTSCEKFLTTEPSDQVSDASALSSAGQLQMSLISAYNQMYFNSSGGNDRLFGGLYGLQLFWDERGNDIMSTTNMGGYQVSSYEFTPSFTRSDGDGALVMWR